MTSYAHKATVLPGGFVLGSAHEFLSSAVEYNMTGVLVHDARRAATMFDYGITDLATLNAKDFARFPFITATDLREAN